MRREFLKGSVALLTASAADSMVFNADAAEDGGPELEARDAAGPFPLPSGARVDRDVAYGSNALQKLDVYHPAGTARGPVIVMVHGGAWMRGSKDMWRVTRNKVAHWVGQGDIFVSVNYRMSPAADPVTQADDVAEALRYVQDHMAGWGGDPNRLILIGHSSGAHLVSLLTADPAISARAGVKPWCATIALDSAAMNVETIMNRQHFKFYDRVFGSDPGYWRQASPTLRLSTRPLAPMLLVCSSLRMDSCPQARAFADRATQLGGRAEVLTVELTHPQINDQLGAATGYTSSVDAFLKSVGVPAT